jgi:hypothetical protein
MFYGKEKDRPSMGVDEPVKTKNCVAGESFGVSESNEEPPPAPLNHIQNDWLMVRRAYEIGYSQGLHEGLAQGPTHPAIQASVARMFGDWQGAEAARQQSTQRFTNWYRKERDAA